MRGNCLAVFGLALLISVATAAQQAPSSNARAGTAKTSGAPTGVAKVIGDSEDAMGMLRSVERVDAVASMEFWASGTSYGSSQPGSPPVEYKVEYHANLAYNQPGMRLENTLTKSDGTGTPQKTIEVVNDKYAWNESELGAGLIPGKGIATPTPNVLRQRLLQLWLLPYGVMKAAAAAGDRTKVTMENGATALAFPLFGELSGLTVKATLDAKKMVSTVETQSNNPSLRDLVVRVTYSDYGDYCQAASDLMFPRRIVETRDGRPVLDLTVREDDPYNPYEIFWTPSSVGRPDAVADRGRVTANNTK